MYLNIKVNGKLMDESPTRDHFLKNNLIFNY